MIIKTATVQRPRIGLLVGTSGSTGSVDQMVVGKRIIGVASGLHQLANGGK